MAVGLTYSYPAEGVTKVTTLAIANGNFDERALAAAGATGAKDKYREQKYKGINIYIFTLDQQVRLFGMFTVRVRELAVCPLDRNTLALGDYRVSGGQSMKSRERGR